METDVNEFNPSYADFYALRNSYKVDIDDAGVAIDGVKSEDDKICKYYLLRQSCKRGVFCKYLHPTPDQIGKRTIEIAKSLDDFKNPDEVYAVEVLSVQNAIRLYAHLTSAKIEEKDGSLTLVTDENKIKERKAMFEAMQSFYKPAVDRYSSNNELGLSDVVAAKVLDGTEWRRARIVDINLQTSEMKVFYVDHGTIEWLPRVHIREITLEFMALPFQAQECILADLGVNPTSDKQSAVEFLLRLTSKRTIYGICAYVVGTQNYFQLYDISNSDCQISINDAMLYKGFAVQEPNFEHLDTPDNYLPG